MYQIAFSHAAAKALRKMPRNAGTLVRRKLDEIATDPYAPRSNVTRLVGRTGYRLRVGDWRVLYELEDDRMIVLVVKIGPRGSIYK